MKQFTRLWILLSEIVQIKQFGGRLDFALEGISKVSFSGFTLWPTSRASQEFLNGRTPCWGTVSVKPFSQDLGSRYRVWLEKKLTLGRAWWTHKSSCLDSSAYSFCWTSVDAFHLRILLQIQSQLKGLLLQLEFIVWICSSTHPLICSYFPFPLTGSLSQLPSGKQWGTVWTGCQGQPFMQPSTLWFTPKLRVANSAAMRESQKEDPLGDHANPAGLNQRAALCCSRLSPLYPVVSFGDPHGSVLGPVPFTCYLAAFILTDVIPSNQKKRVKF